MNSVLTLSKLLLSDNTKLINIDQYLECNITQFRINVSKFLANDYDCLINKILNITNNTQYHSCRFIFDLPFPYRKSRIVKMLEPCWEVDRGQQIHLKQWEDHSPIVSTDVYLDDLNFSIDIGDEIYFADGYGLLVCENKIKSEIILTAKNKFKIYEGKSFSTGATRNSQAEKLFDLCRKITTLIDNPIFALSFLENEKDIDLFCQKIKCAPESILIKIETQKGVDNISNLVPKCGGVILGRGDLLYYAKPKDFFFNCNKIANTTIKQNKSFYLCTDILNSLIEHNIPTRAELTDVFYYKSLGCENFILPAGFSIKGNLKKAIEIINY